MIKEQLEGRGGRWLGIAKEGAWRPHLDRVQGLVIDMVWQGPKDDWQITERFWTTSEHKTISFPTASENLGPRERRIVDWKGVMAARPRSRP